MSLNCRRLENSQGIVVAGVVEVLVEVVVLEEVIMGEDMVILEGDVVVICPVVITETGCQGGSGYEGLVVPRKQLI